MASSQSIQGSKLGNDVTKDSLQLSPSQPFSVISSEERKLLLSLSASKSKKSARSSSISPIVSPRSKKTKLGKHVSLYSALKLQSTSASHATKNSLNEALRSAACSQTIQNSLQMEPSQLQGSGSNPADVRQQCIRLIPHASTGGPPPVARGSQSQKLSNIEMADHQGISQLDFGCSLNNFEETEPQPWFSYGPAPSPLPNSRMEPTLALPLTAKGVISDVEAQELELLSCNPSKQSHSPVVSRDPSQANQSQGRISRTSLQQGNAKVGNHSPKVAQDPEASQKQKSGQPSQSQQSNKAPKHQDKQISTQLDPVGTLKLGIADARSATSNFPVTHKGLQSISSEQGKIATDKELQKDATEEVHAGKSDAAEIDQVSEIIPETEPMDFMAPFGEQRSPANAAGGTAFQTETLIAPETLLMHSAQNPAPLQSKSSQLQIEQSVIPSAAEEAGYLTPCSKAGPGAASQHPEKLSSAEFGSQNGDLSGSIKPTMTLGNKSGLVTREAFSPPKMGIYAETQAVDLHEPTCEPWEAKLAPIPWESGSDIHIAHLGELEGAGYQDLLHRIVINGHRLENGSFERVEAELAPNEGKTRAAPPAEDPSIPDVEGAGLVSAAATAPASAQNDEAEIPESPPPEGSPNLIGTLPHPSFAKASKGSAQKAAAARSGSEKAGVQVDSPLQRVCLPPTHVDGLEEVNKHKRSQNAEPVRDERVQSQVKSPRTRRNSGGGRMSSATGEASPPEQQPNQEPAQTEKHQPEPAEQLIRAASYTSQPVQPSVVQSLPPTETQCITQPADRPPSYEMSYIPEHQPSPTACFLADPPSIIRLGMPGDLIGKPDVGSSGPMVNPSADRVHFEPPSEEGKPAKGEEKATDREEAATDGEGNPALLPRAGQQNADTIGAGAREGHLADPSFRNGPDEARDVEESPDRQQHLGNSAKRQEFEARATQVGVIQAALQDALRGTQCLRETAALNDHSLPNADLDDPVTGSMLAESEEGCSQIQTLASSLAAGNTTIEKLNHFLLRGDCTAWANYVRLNAELDACDTQMGSLSNLERSRLADVFIQFYEQAELVSLDIEQASSPNIPPSDEALLTQSNFTQLQEEVCSEKEVEFRNRELLERGWLDALHKYDPPQNVQDDPGGAAHHRLEDSIIPDSGTFDDKREGAPDWFFPGANNEKKTTISQPASEEVAAAPEEEEQPVVDAACDNPAVTDICTESQYPVVVMRRRPLIFNESSMAELPPTPSDLTVPSDDFPGESQVSRVPETCPEADEEACLAKAGRGAAAGAKAPTSSELKAPLSRSQVAKEAGLRLPNKASQKGAQLQKVVNRLNRRQRKSSLTAELKGTGGRRKVLQSSIPNGLAERVNRMAGRVPSDAQLRPAITERTPGKEQDPPPEPERCNDRTPQHRPMTDEELALPLTVEQFPSFLQAPANQAPLISSKEDRNDNAVEFPNETGEKESPWLPFSTADANGQAPAVAAFNKDEAHLPKEVDTRPGREAADMIPAKRSRSTGAVLARDTGLQAKAKRAKYNDPYSFPDSQQLEMDAKAAKPIGRSNLAPRSDLKKPLRCETVRAQPDDPPANSKRPPASHAQPPTVVGRPPTGSKTAPGAPGRPVADAHKDSALSRPFKLGCSRCRNSPTGCSQCRPENLDLLPLDLRAKILQGNSKQARQHRGKAASLKAKDAGVDKVKASHAAKPRDPYNTRSRQPKSDGPKAKASSKSTSNIMTEGKRRQSLPAKRGKDGFSAGASRLVADSKPPAQRRASHRALPFIDKHGPPDEEGQVPASPPAELNELDRPALDVARAHEGVTTRAKSGRILEGLNFMVSGDKKALTKSLKALGATVVTSIPPYNVDSPTTNNLTAMIGSESQQRTSKLILAWILGLPVLKPSWVEAAQQAADQGEGVPRMWGRHVLREANSGWSKLSGVRVAVSDNLEGADTPLLLQYTGAEVVRPSLLLTQAPATKGNRPSCMLVYHHSTSNQRANAALQAQADRAGVTLISRSWLFDAIESGKSRAYVLAGQEKPEPDAIVPESISPELTSQSQPRSANFGPPPLQPRFDQAAALDQLSGGRQAAAPGRRDSRRASLGGQLTWLSATSGPPEGLNLPLSATRTYYSGFIKEGMRICVGDAVELQPLPGDEETGVAVLEALWADRLPGLPEKWQARCRRYYRPNATSLALGFGSDHVFRSDHIEPRINLAAILGKCCILHCKSKAEGRAEERVAVYQCFYQYDFEHETLANLPCPSLA